MLTRIAGGLALGLLLRFPSAGLVVTPGLVLLAIVASSRRSGASSPPAPGAKG